MNEIKLKILKKEFKKIIICLKTKKNTETSDEENSDSEFYYPQDYEMAEKKS